MVTIKSKKEIELMKEACRVVALTYKELEEKIKQYTAQEHSKEKDQDSAKKRIIKNFFKKGVIYPHFI